MRTSPALELKKSPLVFVLAQVKITPVLKMNDFVPSIQEELRKAGYPHYRREETKEIVFGPEPKLHESHRWLFSDKSKRKSVIISNDFIVLETNSYTVFEDFVTDFQKILLVVQAIVTPELSTRIGLRYVDLINPETNTVESLNSYFHPGLHGYEPKDMNIESPLSRYVYKGKSQIGILQVRLFQTNDNSFLPPDINADELDYSGILSIPHDKELVAILDIDHYSVSDRDFNIDTLIDTLWQLHENAKKSFRNSVTESALEEWR